MNDIPLEQRFWPQTCLISRHNDKTLWICSMSKLDFDPSLGPPAHNREGTGHCMVWSLFHQHINFELQVLHRALCGETLNGASNVPPEARDACYFRCFNDGSVILVSYRRMILRKAGTTRNAEYGARGRPLCPPLRVVLIATDEWEVVEGKLLRKTSVECPRCVSTRIKVLTFRWKACPAKLELKRLTSSRCGIAGFRLDCCATYKQIRPMQSTTSVEDMILSTAQNCSQSVRSGYL